MLKLTVPVAGMKNDFTFSPMSIVFGTVYFAACWDCTKIEFFIEDYFFYLPNLPETAFVKRVVNVVPSTDITSFRAVSFRGPVI